MHIRGATTANATETKRGGTIVVAVIEVRVWPMLDMTWTSTKPTTSSIIAALVSTTPSLDCVKPLVPRTANVVPKLVEQSEAPAAKHWIEVALVRR